MLALSTFASLTVAMVPVQQAVSQPSPAAAAAPATIIAQRTGFEFGVTTRSRGWISAPCP